MIKHTPIERHLVDGIEVWVKREDLCFSPPAPPFSKMRGLFDHLQKKKAEGIRRVAYVETPVSMAGWGIAWACRELGLECVLFDPKEKFPPLLHQRHRKIWKELGAEIVPVPAGRASVNFHRAKKMLRPGDYLMPLGLPLEESVRASEKELLHTIAHQILPNTIVVCVGSGTICAGLVRGIFSAKSSGLQTWNPTLFGVLSRTGSPEAKKRSIVKKAGIPFFPNMQRILILEDPGWNYTELCKIKSPFPCHPYYDKKAWKFLAERVYNFKKPILFWNIGSANTKHKGDVDGLL